MKKIVCAMLYVILALLVAKVAYQLGIEQANSIYIDAPVTGPIRL